MGEKLAATRVSTVLDAALPAVFGGQRPRLRHGGSRVGGPRRLRPTGSSSRRTLPDARLHEAAQAIERALCEGYHYRYARELGQLGPVRALRVTEGSRRYEARCIALGQRAGDIKPTDLHRQAGWTAWFSQQGAKRP